MALMGDSEGVEPEGERLIAVQGAATPRESMLSIQSPVTPRALDSFFGEVFTDAAALYPNGRFPDGFAILAHSSLSSFGRVQGGERAVLASLLKACRSRRATLAMPAHRDGEAPPWSGRCLGMGRVAERFRRMADTVHSAHPTLAFSARGPRARELLKGHQARSSLGMGSPLGALYRADALVLMLGVGYGSCTAIHLAEYEVAERAREAGHAPDEVTCWHRGKSWADIAYRADLFPAIGEAFEREKPSRVMRRKMPEGECRAFLARDIVEYSIDTLSHLR
jgi:aminoglycoside 3-N-acetyltransferase